MEEIKTKNKRWCVYMHTNKINNKVYVGQTCQNPPERRWGVDGKGYKNSPHFWSAIQKYGWDNFEHKILFIGLTHKESSQKEIELIALYDSTNPKNGYNHSTGGMCSAVGIRLSKETRKKMSESHKKREFTEKRKKQLDEIRTTKAVVQLDKQGNFICEYASIVEAATKTNTSSKNISACCYSRKKSIGGFMWVFKENYSEDKNYQYRIYENIKKKIVQLDKNNNFIKEYESIAEAERQIKTSNGHISECCRKKRNSAGGYKWMYKEDWEEIQSAKDIESQN